MTGLPRKAFSKSLWSHVKPGLTLGPGFYMFDFHRRLVVALPHSSDGHYVSGLGYPFLAVVRPVPHRAYSFGGARSVAAKSATQPQISLDVSRRVSDWGQSHHLAAAN